MQSKRSYKAELVVLFGFFIMFISTSLKGVYQVYFSELIVHYHTNVTNLAIVGGLFGLTQGLFSAVVGKISDRYGAPYVLISGTFMAFVGFAIFAFSDNFISFIIGFVLFSAYSISALTFVPVSVLIDNFVTPSKRSIAYAITTNGIAIGFVILSPLWIYLNGIVKWRAICTTLSYIFLALSIIMVFYIRSASRHNLNQQYKTTKLTSLPKNWYFNRKLILLILAFSGCGSSMSFIDIHFVPTMQEILNYTQSAKLFMGTSLSLLGIFEFIGSVLIGLLITRNKSLPLLLALLFFVRCFALFFVLLYPYPIVLLLFSIVFGITYMGTVIIISRLSGDIFGQDFKGYMFGIIFLFHQISGLLTAWIGGLLRTYLGSYLPVLYLVIFWLLLSALSSLMLISFKKTNLNSK
ncbi:hypothetical protein BHC44_00980 [Snodgrassella alvi]|nr:hypothetical protein BHC44_00980 [Snodgrassella alvi]